MFISEIVYHGRHTISCFVTFGDVVMPDGLANGNGSSLSEGDMLDSVNELLFGLTNCPGAGWKGMFALLDTARARGLEFTN